MKFIGRICKQPNKETNGDNEMCTLNFPVCSVPPICNSAGDFDSLTIDRPRNQLEIMKC